MYLSFVFLLRFDLTFLTENCFFCKTRASFCDCQQKKQITIIYYIFAKVITMPAEYIICMRNLSTLLFLNFDVKQMSLSP